MSFYEKLVELCNREGTSPSAVARDIGLSNSSATYWKRGSMPKYSTLKELAAYFAVTPDYLLGLTDNAGVMIATQSDIDHFGEKKPEEGWGLTEHEQDHMEKYKRLPVEDRKRIDMILDYDFKRLIDSKK